MAIGRKPHTDKLGLEKVGVKQHPNGKIIVSQSAKNLLQTNVPNIYAIGDVIEGPMLAHKAEEDGVAAVECIKNGTGHINWSVVPNVI